jgi:hypothetical protein
MPERDAAHCQNNRHQLMYHTDELTPVHAEFYFCRTITDIMQASYSGHIMFFDPNRSPWFFH